MREPPVKRLQTRYLPNKDRDDLQSVLRKAGKAGDNAEGGRGDGGGSQEGYGMLRNAKVEGGSTE
jgi:hypothetical protein